MARTATPAKQRVPLTRERIAGAALRIMDTEGLDAVSMRRVAREVGVEAMSLYNHVHDKDDLLGCVLEQVMKEFSFPPTVDSDDWLDEGRALARAWRRLLRTHPSVLQLFAERKTPLNSIDGLRPMDAALTALRNSGLSDSDAVQAFHAIGGYIFGFVMMESGRLFGTGETDPKVFPQIPAELLPSVAACMPYLAKCDFDEQFEFGLDLMLEGLRAKVGG
jgi:TetR/AcrR family tetracycline transcriptional repressor